MPKQRDSDNNGHHIGRPEPARPDADVPSWAESTESAEPEHTHDPHEVTVQLDNVGRHLDDWLVQQAKGAPGAQGDQEGSDGPVFVDETGRRSRRYRRIGMAVGLTCAVYAVIIVATLMSGNSSAPWLPVPGKADKPAGKVDSPTLPPESAGPSGSANPSSGLVPSAGAGTSRAPGAGTSPSTSASPSDSGKPTDADPSPTSSKPAPTKSPTGPDPTKDPTADPTTSPDPGTDPDPDPDPTLSDDPADPPAGDDPVAGPAPTGGTIPVDPIGVIDDPIGVVDVIDESPAPSTPENFL
ncbi:hypothetical protein [Streptomyces scabichelini]|uniref:hypothetical protein n=1 Tax=Streptomyces scabichelini TaxID=2711217 RepID=UPI0019D170CA|nr:hypothetical protein [Streptomyces scabichelini]